MQNYSALCSIRSDDIEHRVVIRLVSAETTYDDWNNKPNQVENDKEFEDASSEHCSWSNKIDKDVDNDNQNEEVTMAPIDYPDLTSHFTTDMLFDSKENVREWCMNRGIIANCIVVTKRTRMRNLLSNGKGSWMVLVCERSGEYIDHKPRSHAPKTQQKRRRCGSRKCGCPFELSARCIDDGRWVLTVKDGRHNDLLPNVLTGHPYVARLNEHEVKTVETMTKSGVRPRNILTAIKSNNPENQSTLRSIYNAKVKLKLHNTEGRSIMQQFMKLAHSHNYSVHHRVDGTTNEVSDLFFSHPRCVVLAQCFHQILFLDCTFKTNRYKLPCFHMVSQTSTGSSFTVALAFISRETTESYIWALECVRKCYREKEIPNVIITDAEIALSNAVASVFPVARHILCAWHISKNVQANCKPNFIKKKRIMINDKEVVLDDEEGKKQYEQFWDDWVNVINSLSEEEYHRNLKLFRDAWIGKQKKAITYVLKNWLSKYKEMFVLAWTNKVKHYDNVSTSIVESAHARLKLYFNSAVGSFVQCWTSAHLCCENELVAIENAFELSTSRTMHRFRTQSMFKDLLGFVSHKALDLLLEELRRISTMGLSIENCGCVLWQVNGLPCAHMLMEFRHSNGFIPLSVVDYYWKQLSCTPPTLHRSTLDFLDLPELQVIKSRYDESSDNVRLDMQQQLKLMAFPQTTTILEPPVATIRKGRPSKKEKSNKRDPSYFEHVELSLSCSSNLTPVGRHLKKLGVKNKACEKNQVDNYYLLQLPENMRQYIIDIEDMPSNGNCGYWVMVNQLNLFNKRLENPCKYVREAMVDNLVLNSQMYRRMWDDTSYDEMKERIQCTNEVGISEWMQMPESGFVIAETFGTLVVLLSKHMSCTFVPTTVCATMLNQNRMVVMGYVNSSHFVSIKLTADSPLPPTPQYAYFQQFYNINAEDWIKPYMERLNKYVASTDGHKEDTTVISL